MAESTAPRPTLLIIEDDLLLADAIARTLRDRYEISIETSATGACQRLTAGSRFSAILSDISMPGMNGMDLFDWMSDACPDQASRVLFITGGTEEVHLRPFITRFKSRVVSKPFERAMLIKRIDAVLSGA